MDSSSAPQVQSPEACPFLRGLVNCPLFKHKSHIKVHKSHSVYSCLSQSSYSTFQLSSLCFYFLFSSLSLFIQVLIASLQDSNILFPNPFAFDVSILIQLMLKHKNLSLPSYWCGLSRFLTGWIWYISLDSSIANPCSFKPLDKSGILLSSMTSFCSCCLFTSCRVHYLQPALFRSLYSQSTWDPLTLQTDLEEVYCLAFKLLNVPTTNSLNYILGLS